MSPRKRPRPNPASEESTTSLPATLPSQASGATSQRSTLNRLLPSTLGQGMPTTKRDDSNASAVTTPSDRKQVRKSRSWYGSWSRVPKSSASTQIARETIMGGTTRSAATPDFSRYCTRKNDNAADSDAQSTKTLPQVTETGSQSDCRMPTPAESTANRNEETDTSKDRSRDRAATISGPAPTPSDPDQRQTASAGWITSWFARQPELETPSAPVGVEPDAPKESETVRSVTPSQQEQTQLPQTPVIARPTSSWFGLWSTPTNQESSKGTGKAANDDLGERQIAPKEDQGTVSKNAPPLHPTATQPSAGSTWAFWSRDTGPRDASRAAVSPEQGELAVIGDGSEASPRRSTAMEVNETVPPIKESPLKAAKDQLVKGGSFRKSKRVRPQSISDLDQTTPVRPTTPGPDTSTKARQSASTPTTPHQNLLLPSFRNTYRMKENPSIIKQISQLLLRTQQPTANHVFLAKEPPKLKKAIAIGVHGLFPASFLRPMIGQPTGTSIRFANHCAEAIRRWTESHGCGDCRIEKVALEGEGKINERVDNLWKLLLNWIEHIRGADLIMIACHSQGVPVGVMLLAKLIDLGIITHSRIGVCAMAGVSLGPFPDYKSGMGMLMGTAAELWQFAEPDSEVSQRYEHALRAIVNHGARITYIGSIDDQLVPLESAVYSPASHPYIYRAVFIDGRIHAPDFIAHLVGFALKLRNLGISDHGLIRELSVPLAGSLYSGEGHSRLYDDEQVYDLGVSHALETTTIPGVPCHVEKHEGLNNPNPYVLPWIMRGLLEEEFVKTELYSETTELLKQFDDWLPTTKALKDVKYRLEAVRSRL